LITFGRSSSGIQVTLPIVSWRHGCTFRSVASKP
jgi:hypothetical protein